MQSKAEIDKWIGEYLREGGKEQRIHEGLTGVALHAVVHVLVDIRDTLKTISENLERIAKS